MVIRVIGIFTTISLPRLFYLILVNLKFIIKYIIGFIQFSELKNFNPADFKSCKRDFTIVMIIVSYILFKR